MDFGDLRKHLWSVLFHNASRSGLDFARHPTAELHPKFLSLPLKPIDECFTRQNRRRCHRNVRFRARPLLDPNLLTMDEERLAKEVFLFADRSDISEELTRLESHLAQLEHHLRKDEPVGRTLEFIVQEIFRELNTLGAKANDAEIAQRVVACKTEVEKIREQVQNLE